MLAPEVWAFDPPSNKLKIVEGSLDSCEEIERTIVSHPFNHLVSVVLPDTLQVPHDILDALSADNEYYKVSNISAHEFVEKEFLDAFVKRGHITALSVDSCIDLDNCLSIDGGQLMLSLNKESYQELGLEGKAIPSKSKEHQRYIVTLDLTVSHFVPGKKNYERAYSCLKNCLQTFDVVLSWKPQDDKICPSSVASYFCGLGLKVDVCKPKFIQRTDYGIAVPQLHPPGKECDIEEMIEWLGLYSLDDSVPANEFLSSYSDPEETVVCGQVVFLCWEGLFTTFQVKSLFQALREYLGERDTVPWVSLYVQGFADVPACWNAKPQEYFSDGDNSYTVVLKPGSGFVLVSQYSNTKIIK
ncbi:hypothetical protein ONE63_004138 [Megalurothrips usitatus]|uniref:Uncharacterized protein n=1 Tax=Megalurothrips usitatus TaxID=439358 RepID=A0AAV7X1W4_9NEOP|nr:hypothetical protein ONE63_004138 [Megalurothrips usitatus]